MPNKTYSNSTPFFSIIIPSYNSAEYIAHTLSSIQNQSFSDFEIIVVDDNSFDNTTKCVSNFAEKDSRIKILTNENNFGPNYSRNLGVKNAKGKFVIFIDSDDMLLPNALALVFNSVNKQDVEILNFGFQFKKGQKIIKKSNFKSDTLAGESIIQSFIMGRIYSVCWNKAYSLQFLEQSRISFIEDMTHGRDAIFTLDCMMNAKKIKFVNQIIYSSTVRNDSFSRNFSIKNVDSLIQNLKEIQLRFRKLNLSKKSTDPYVAKHLRYIVVLSAFRMADYISFKKAITILKSSGYYNTLFLKQTLKKLTPLDALISLVIAFPLSLFFLARILNRLNIRPY